MAASAMERRYQLAREDISTQQRGQTEQEKEALRRRFATIGGLGSGASIKAEQSAEREGARRLATGMSAITQQELGDKQRLEEIDQGQKFQTSERMGSQGFQTGERLGSQLFSTGEREAGQKFVSGENKIGREFQTSERMGAQGFQSGEADKQRGFMTKEREAGQAFTTSERTGAQAFSQGEKLRVEALEKLKIEITQAELELNKKISAANLDLSKKTADIQEKQAKGGILTSILGTGITGGMTSKNSKGGSISPVMMKMPSLNIPKMSTKLRF